MAEWRILYKFDGKPTSFNIKLDEGLTKEQVLVEVHRREPQMTTIYDAQRVYSLPSVRYELEFSLTQDVANFLFVLLDKSHFYLECNDHHSKEVEDKYFELTGEAIMPESGRYNIAPDAKWGVESNINFDPDAEFPVRDLGIELEKPGQVNSVALFWTLVRMGFRLDGNHEVEQVMETIFSCDRYQDIRH